MKEIPLSNGGAATIDDEDFDVLSLSRWRKFRSRRAFYVQATSGPHRWKLMHRVVLRAVLGEMIDHKNRNGLDNRKENLRRCTSSQNNGNRAKHAKNGKTSPYKGVCYDKKQRKFLAQISHQKFGRFDSEVAAARAYDEAARAKWGVFARLNFPRDGEESAHQG